MEELSSQDKPDIEIEAGFCGDFDATVTHKKKEDNEDVDGNRRANKRIRELEDENEELAKKIRVLEEFINSNWIFNKPGELFSPDEAIAAYFDPVSTASIPSTSSSWSLYVYSYGKVAYIGISSELNPYNRIRRHWSKWGLTIKEDNYVRKTEHYRQMKEEKSSDFIESRFSVIVYNSLTKKLAEQIESGAELKSRNRIF